MILSASRGLTVTEMFEFEPALEAEYSFFPEADVLEVTGVRFVTTIVFF